MDVLLVEDKAADVDAHTFFFHLDFLVEAGFESTWSLRKIIHLNVIDRKPVVDVRECLR
jgi:hypothetical protein